MYFILSLALANHFLTITLRKQAALLMLGNYANPWERKSLCYFLPLWKPECLEWSWVSSRSRWVTWLEAPFVIQKLKLHCGCLPGPCLRNTTIFRKCSHLEFTYFCSLRHTLDSLLTNPRLHSGLCACHGKCLTAHAPFLRLLALLPRERLQWNKTGKELNKTSQQKPCWETTHSVVYLLQNGVLTLQPSSDA